MEVLNVVKIGGSIIEDSNKLDLFLESFAALKHKKILIHGGGLLASELGQKLGIVEQKVDGRRITDDKTLDLVTMVYGGLINKKLVAKLNSYDCRALGLTGADGDYLRSSRRPPINDLDYGWVGDPTNVRTAFLNNLFEEGIVPVAAPLTHDGCGHLLNTNADTIASTIASAMSEYYNVNLIYAFELNGVLVNLKDEGSLVKQLTFEKYADLKASGIIANGMIPKLDNSFDALENGVTHVKLVKYDRIGMLEHAEFDEFTTITP